MKVIVLVSMLAMIGCASSKKQAAPAPVTSPMAAKAAAPEPAPASDKLTCEKGKDSRTLEVVKKGDGCALAYTKASGTKNVATSAHGTKHCDDAKTKISAKLEKSGYTCN